MQFLFILLVIAVSAFAKDWTHYYGQSEVRDVVKTENGTLWAAFAWGLQERSAKGQVKSYTPGSDGLEVADFVQIFVLQNEDIIAVSRNGILVRKNRNSNRFETVNSSFAEKKRILLNGLGQMAGNILILPFGGALAFFDYSTARSVITLLQIGTSSLEEYDIKRIAVKGDSVWVDLDTVIWKRKIVWDSIHADNYLAEPSSWTEAKDKKIPSAIKKPTYTAVTNFPMQNVKTISLIPGKGAVAWDYYSFSKMQDENWEQAFKANASGYGDDQKTYLTKSLALLPNGNFAAGMWGPGVLIFNGDFPYASMTGLLHSKKSDNKCPTQWSSVLNDGYTIAQGLTPSPDNSGYIFSYFSEPMYGLGISDYNGKNYSCEKPEGASSSYAFSIITRENNRGKWEIYVAWRNSKDLGEASGGVDLYELANPKIFNPVLNSKWILPFGSPLDFAFDSKGILWAVSSSKIFYLDEKENEWKEPEYIRGFEGGNISALETDAQNGLWIGTLGNGAYSFSQIDNSPDSLVAKHFKIKDGLLSETVYDLAIDTVKGKVYFAQDLGLSIYSTALVRGASDYMQEGAPKTIAYPVPFRPNVHSAITIDYISEKSSVYILDSSGKRVKFFSGSDLKGGAVVWDGKNESGKSVAPGLYYYIAADGKKTVKGKIIIER